jgi:hypothetical protein
LAKIAPDIQQNPHYQAFLRLLNLAHHDHIYYTYEPSYTYDPVSRVGDIRFVSWRLQDEFDRPIPFIIPYVQRFEFAIGDDAVTRYYDYWVSRDARKQAGKTDKLSLDSMQDDSEPEDVGVDMDIQRDLFTAQWIDENGDAYEVLREMKAEAMKNIRSDPDLEIQGQMLGLNWWDYKDQLFGAKGDPALGKEFQEVCSEAVRPEEGREEEGDVF